MKKVLFLGVMSIMMLVHTAHAQRFVWGQDFYSPFSYDPLLQGTFGGYGYGYGWGGYGFSGNQFINDPFFVPIGWGNNYWGFQNGGMVLGSVANNIIGGVVSIINNKTWANAAVDITTDQPRSSRKSEWSKQSWQFQEPQQPQSSVIIIEPLPPPMCTTYYKDVWGQWSIAVRHPCY